VPFLSERQRDYLQREHPAVYRRFLRDERTMGFELRAPADVSEVAKRRGGGGHKQAAGFETEGTTP
jgi:hypothetical protein